MQHAAPPPHARVACAAGTYDGAVAAWRHARRHAGPAAAIAMSPHAAVALAHASPPGEKSSNVERLLLPPAYAHCWQEFPRAPPESPLWVWCDTDHVWETVQAHRPHAIRWIISTKKAPTFPAAPLHVDAETGTFTWRLAHGSHLREWGPLS